MKTPARRTINQRLSGHMAHSLFIGFLAAFVGFTSSFAVVLQGLRGVGASEAQAASGLLAASVAMGLCGIILSLKTRMPVSVAWSTPGAALLAVTLPTEAGFSDAVGAFIICGGLIFICGVWQPFQRLVNAIPATLANALLAGVLLSLCLAPFKAIAFDPLLGLPIVLAWVVGNSINRLAGVPFALAAFIAVVVFAVDLPENWSQVFSASLVPEPVWIIPTFSPQALLGIALPLFVVTMASQNIPGLAVLKANEYEADIGSALRWTGGFSVLFASLGSHAVNLAAITAALLAGEEAGSEKQKRYYGAVVCGVGYILFGLFAGITTAFVSFAPAILIEAVAGLALIGAFSSSVVAAFKDEETRMPAAITFLSGASGMSLFGISGAFWGLIGGAVMLFLLNRKKSARADG